MKRREFLKLTAATAVAGTLSAPAVRAQSSTVKVGVVGYTYTQVISGLQVGDSVVLANYSAAVPSSSATTLGGFGGGGFGGAGGFTGGAGGGGRFTAGGAGGGFGGG